MTHFSDISTLVLPKARTHRTIMLLAALNSQQQLFGGLVRGTSTLRILFAESLAPEVGRDLCLTCGE